MKMKNIILLLFLASIIWSCQYDDFADNYADPSKVAQTTPERQYTGIIQAGVDYIVPSYRNYFVTLMGTLNPWTQSIGWINSPGQYVPGSSGVEDVWFNYYDIMAQYREFQKVYDELEAERQSALKVFKLTADVYLYHETQRMVDLYGTFPFFEAGKLSQNGGDYSVSYAAFDSGDAIYGSMLDELKRISSEFQSLTLSAGTQVSFSAQDIINRGDLDLWRRFTNSLRLKMLTRVSGASQFSARATSEIAEIMGNSSAFPLIEENSQNSMIDVYDINTSINSIGFDQGINSNGWDGDDAPKVMIDRMVSTADPRLRVLFEPGEASNGEYIGLDPMMEGSDQEALRASNATAFYNRTTTSLNQYFPGVLMNAAEVSFLKAEALLNAGNLTGAKEAYETGIKQSTEFYYTVNGLSADRTSGTPDPVSDEEMNTYLAGDNINWDMAATDTDRLELIALQKWIHYNIIQPYENWAEVRRLDTPQLSFWNDPSNEITQPPMRFYIPGNEITFNAANYDAVRDQVGLKTRIFWDVK